MANLNLLSRGNIGPGVTATTPYSRFGERAAVSLATEYEDSNVIQDMRQGSALRDRQSLVEQRFKKDIFSLTGTDKKYVNPTTEGRLEQVKETNLLLDQMIETGRKDSPEEWQGIKTAKELMGEQINRVRQARGENELQRSRSESGLGVLATDLIGSFGDPVNATASAINLPGTIVKGTALQIAKGIGMVALKEGALNAGIEATQIAGRADLEERLGNEYTADDALKEIALAFGAGAVLGGGFKGTAVGLEGAVKKFRGSDLARNLADRVGGLTETERDAFKYLERENHIREKSPLSDDRLAASHWHRNTLNKVGDQFNNHQEIQVDDPGLRAAASASERNLVSDENGAPISLKSDGTQDLPSHSTKPNGSFDTANILPASRKGRDASLGDIDTTSNSIIYHSHDNATKLLKIASDLKPKLDQYLNSVAEIIDGLNVYGSRIKEAKDFIAKAKRKGRPVRTISDVLGGRLVADTPEAIDRAIAEIQSRSKVLEIDNKLADGTGYRAVHIIVATKEGVGVEIQIQPKEIREVQDVAHEKYYTKWRNVNKNTMSADQQAEYFEDMAAQERLFNDAWDRWEKRTTQEKVSHSDKAAEIELVKTANGGKNNAQKALGFDADALESAQKSGAFEAEYQRLLAEDPGFKIEIDGEEMTLRDLDQTLKENEAMRSALTVCGIGK